MSACRSCAAPVIWAKTIKGKAIALDPEPVPGGNVYLDQSTMRAMVVSPDGTPLHVAHFATCPDADGWRKR